MPYKANEFTCIDTEFGSYLCCNNCGATAEKPKEIVHHKTCEAGEAKRWEDFYSKKENQS